MKYQKVIGGVFLSRPNRFIAKVAVEGCEQTVHVKNTGRCRELLVPGAAVWLSCADNPARKTAFDLIAVQKQTERGPLLINMDSQIPNDAAEEWLRKGLLFSRDAHICREVVYGASRFDFYIEDGERKAFLEVKGVTLEQGGIASFPDAPTERGIKHLGELIACRREGYEAFLLFVIQMKGITAFTPADSLHPAFGTALRRAASEGVTVLARDCLVTPDSMVIADSVPIIL